MARIVAPNPRPLKKIRANPRPVEKIRANPRPVKRSALSVTAA